ncbi:hypothetical protein BDV30DRAFT_142197 [Aspergillus minisclerotigenes]|uniref:Uncharacterized protein n=1 Tax=Aspergillus minisclerotigenes TaxID=656917 RepID=A0A5N6JIE4_9EURO|nr:hypothetical protein BDV30DRAFT_142197 [Aspergillus minisclerotigenes]
MLCLGRTWFKNELRRLETVMCMCRLSFPMLSLIKILWWSVLAQVMERIMFNTCGGRPTLSDLGLGIRVETPGTEG